MRAICKGIFELVDSNFNNGQLTVTLSGEVGSTTITRYSFELSEHHIQTFSNTYAIEHTSFSGGGNTYSLYKNNRLADRGETLEVRTLLMSIY